jgi:hypothetical protein
LQSYSPTARLRAALFTGLFFHVETCYQSLSLILTNKGRLDSGGVSRCGAGGERRCGDRAREPHGER